MAEKKVQKTNTKKPNYVKTSKPGYDRWDNSGVRVVSVDSIKPIKKGK